MSRRQDEVAAGHQVAPATAAPATAAPSPVRTLQRSLGNARLLQLQVALRRPVTQRRDDGEAIDADVSVSGGAPLPPAVQARAESALGVPLADVRVVNDASTCSRLGAHAFAMHQEQTPYVVLGQSVDAGTTDGEFTMMHELAHIAQQRRGETAGLDGLGGDADQRERLERDADRAAAAALTRSPA